MSSDAVKVIYREEGFIGYYRGIVPALFLTSHGAVQFAVYEQFKSAYKVFQGHGHHEQVLKNVTCLVNYVHC